MYIESFTIHNFLNFEHQVISFENFTTLENNTALKAFYIFKFLLTLSEEHPNLVTLICNEKRPFENEEISFEIVIHIYNYTYHYKIILKRGKVLYELFREIKIKPKIIYQRLENEVILDGEPILWNCPNHIFKPFLNTCATKNNYHGQTLFYFFKEKILGFSNWIKNSLNDDINDLFNNKTTAITSIIQDIPIINNNIFYYHYGDDVSNLNKLLTNLSFENLKDSNTQLFFKINIYLLWLNIIEGGILIIDDKYSLKYLDYMKTSQKHYPNIQYIIIKTN